MSVSLIITCRILSPNKTIKINNHVDPLTIEWWSTHHNKRILMESKIVYHLSIQLIKTLKIKMMNYNILKTIIDSLKLKINQIQLPLKILISCTPCQALSIPISKSLISGEMNSDHSLFPPFFLINLIFHFKYNVFIKLNKKIFKEIYKL